VGRGGRTETASLFVDVRWKKVTAIRWRGQWRGFSLALDMKFYQMRSRHSGDRRRITDFGYKYLRVATAKNRKERRRMARVDCVRSGQFLTKNMKVKPAHCQRQPSCYLRVTCTSHRTCTQLRTKFRSLRPPNQGTNVIFRDNCITVLHSRKNILRRLP
jgi:hypothetical protein